MEDLAGIGKLAESELAKRAYEDIASGPARETGKLATDLVKTMRLFMAPFQLLAQFQDRFGRWLNGVRDSVPAERQIEAAPEIAGPVLLNLRFLSDENQLKHLYLNLLRLAIDRDNCDKAHPGFVKIIEQLSPRDAHLLQALAKVSPIEKKLPSTQVDLPEAVVVKQSSPVLADWTLNDIQSSLDLFRGLSVLYFDDFNIANFVDGPNYKLVKVRLTEFGKSFVAACVPADIEFI